MFESTCTLPLTAELFAQAIHPSEPIVAVGLSTGHVQSYRLPSDPSNNTDDDDAAASVVSAGTATIETEWRTRRYKGSCRCLGFSHDGEVLYSAGYDGIVKAASSSTGKVVSKIAVPWTSLDQTPDPPTLLHALSPQTLIIATDAAAVHLYDLRDASTFTALKPAQTHRPHDDYVSSLTPLPPSEASTSGFSKQWVTTGGTTLAVTDLRKGVLVRSEDQEEELLSSVFVSGLRSRPGRSKGEKLVIGSSTGVLTLWERGVWDDQDERIIIDGQGGESIDALALMPQHVGDGGKNIAAGMGDGTVRIVKLGPNKVTHSFQHDEVEGVVALGFDVEGRMISGGGESVKVWEERMDLAAQDSDEDSDSDDDSDADLGKGQKRGRAHNDSDDDSDNGAPRKMQQNGRSKLGQYGGHGVLGFDGMD